MQPGTAAKFMVGGWGVSVSQMEDSEAVCIFMRTKCPHKQSKTCKNLYQVRTFLKVEVVAVERNVS